MIDVEMVVKFHDAQEVALLEGKCFMIGFRCQEIVDCDCLFQICNIDAWSESYPMGKNIIYCFVLFVDVSCVEFFFHIMGPH
jgi:hypothetical protein